jgi:hypothetical protein
MAKSLCGHDRAKSVPVRTTEKAASSPQMKSKNVQFRDPKGEDKIVLMTVPNQDGTLPTPDSQTRSVIEMIKRCLTLTDRWMTRDEIAALALSQGMPLDPKNGRLILSDALHYHTQKGTLALRNGTYGLPAWEGIQEPAKDDPAK